MRGDPWLRIGLALALLTLAGPACKKATFEVVVDGGGGSVKDAPADLTTPRICPADALSRSKSKAESCTCDRECQSGFCVDGVCCTSLCGDTCMACNLPSSLGDCSPVPAGAQPTDASQCLASTPATCGLDGTCDGKGGCRKYVRGTECKAGSCDGDSVVGIRTCDGAGSCSDSKSQTCPPYSCDPATNRCASKCSSDAQCSSGHQCQSSSCGKSVNGAVCDGDDACLSGFCVDNVCCNLACNGACLTCKQTGSFGHCTYIGAGLADSKCGVDDHTTCGNTGLCDGSGQCTLYPENTPCSASSCSGYYENTQRVCDGHGTCKAAQLIDCSPFLCSSGACETSCDPSNPDSCVSGHACESTATGGVCGKRKNGQVCQSAGDCESGQCVDGVCCESSCTGACRSCNLAGSPGQCVNVAAGATDPRKTCKDLGTNACSTNGLCDGQGACQSYPAGTSCSDESCDSSDTYTPPGTCNATGQCVPSRTHKCNPYHCNGSACFLSCTSDSQCTDGNVCRNGSCGLKLNGTDCSEDAECGSGFCAQGVCCESACTDACKACNLTATAGVCTTVANGTLDPQGKCTVTQASTCGTTGTCQNGGCAKYAQGVHCKAAACASSSTLTPTSTCDGKGACLTPSVQSCGNFVCTSGACKNSCTTATQGDDCVFPAICLNGSCGLKANGAACSSASQCQSGFCTEGVCCNSACSDASAGGLCKTCKGTSTVAAGTCGNVAAGAADPKSRCGASDAAAGDCSNSGTCDGAGSCAPWSTSAGCRKESCSAGMHTLVATCDGKGTCPAAQVVSCYPYVCGTSSQTCLNTCSADVQCSSGLECVAGSCGKGPGDTCAASSECATGLVCSAEGVCCDKACSGGCESCKATLGTCVNIAKGSSPRTSTTCPAVADGVCGDTGSCDGSGGCETRTSCTVVSTTCVDTHTQVAAAGTCSSQGTCTPQNQACQTGYLCTGGTCATSCTSSAVCDTAAGYNCINGACAKKPVGATCMNANECQNGQCVDGYCCGSASCAAGYTCTGGTCGNSCSVSSDCAKGYICASDKTCKAPFGSGQACQIDGECASGYCVDAVCCAKRCGDCQSCNLSGSEGTCSNVAAGTADGSCVLVCSDYKIGGLCDGSGGCKPLQPCPGNFACASSTACVTSACSKSSDCAPGYTCDASSQCTALKAVGTACSSPDQCATVSGQSSGNCVNGVCCSTATCADCWSCNITGNAGTCAPVAAGVGDGACAAACAAGDNQESGCNGTGSCRAAPVTCAGGFMCGSNNRCATGCSSNSDCASGYTCDAPACVAN